MQCFLIGHINNDDHGRSTSSQCCQLCKSASLTTGAHLSDSRMVSFTNTHGFAHFWLLSTEHVSTVNTKVSSSLLKKLRRYIPSMASKECKVTNTAKENVSFPRETQILNVRPTSPRGHKKPQSPSHLFRRELVEVGLTKRNLTATILPLTCQKENSDDCDEPRHKINDFR